MRARPEHLHERHNARRPDRGGQPLVLALHCSGADGSQWRKLAQALAPQFSVLAPDLIGSGTADAWHGRHSFTLADDAEAVLAVIDRAGRPVHLVGHSYGGGLALHIAAARASALASLTLYEPSAFHLLGQLGPRAAGELAEIKAVSNAIRVGLLTGALVDAARTFVDYWSGPGTWSGLRREAQSALMRWLPHATLHFEALLCATARLADAQPDGPVLVLRGEHAPGPSRLIADLVARTLAGKPAEFIRGAGHMGPLTHADTVNERIARHLRDAEGRSTWPPSTTSCGALAKPPGAGQTTFITGERPRKDLSPTEDQPHLI